MQSSLLSTSLYCCAMKQCIRGVDMSTPLCILVILATDIFPILALQTKTTNPLHILAMIWYE